MEQTTTAPVLWAHQENGVADIRSAFTQYRRLIYVLPTGGGKTIVFCYVAANAIAKGNRVLILVHRAEILDQISRALDSFGVPHGRIQPGYPQSELPCQIGMVQTVARRLGRLAEPTLIVADEAHHAVSATWTKVLAAFPTAKILGVSATPERLDGRGLGEIFDKMVVGPDMRDLIGTGHLADFIYLAPDSRIDLSGLRMQAGDYVAAELAERVDQRMITGDVIEHYRRHLDGRTAIAFCCTVAHAEHVAEQFNEAGIAAASIDGSMTPAQRRELVDALRTGTITVLTSCELISEGFDAPAVGGAILLRPTASFALYRQQIGRCLRPKADGSAATILDHAGNVYRHALPDSPHTWSLAARPRGKSHARAQIRKCKACNRVFAKSATRDQCPEPGVEGCLFERGVPIVATGSLEAITAQPAWANGIDIRTGCYSDLLRLADGQEHRLRTMQVARGYKPGWLYYTMQAHAATDGIRHDAA